MRHKKQAEAGRIFFLLPHVFIRKEGTDYVKMRSYKNCRRIKYSKDCITARQEDGWCAELLKHMQFPKTDRGIYSGAAATGWLIYRLEERKFANASEKLRAEVFALKDAGFADIRDSIL